MSEIDRRKVLGTAGAAGVAAALPLAPAPAQAAELKLGPAKPFSFDALKAEAARLAKIAYKPPSQPSPEIMEQLNYEEWGKIRYDNGSAVYATGPQLSPVTFFHLGKFFRTHRVELIDERSFRETEEIPKDLSDSPVDTLLLDAVITKPCRRPLGPAANRHQHIRRSVVALCQHQLDQIGD